MSLVLVTLPFVLVRNVYPLFRMGMFAEANIPDSLSLDVYVPAKINQNNHITLLTEKDTGVPEHMMNYLARNYFFRSEGDLFLSQLRQLPTLDSNSFKLAIVKQTVHKTATRQTILVSE